MPWLSRFSSHETARFARRFRRRLVFVGRFYPNAGLYDPPPPYSGNGRPRVKGAKRPKPEQVVADGTPSWKTRVDWYGGERRRVAIRSGQGHWYQAGGGLVPIRWVYVEDREGTHRPDYFFSTDPMLGQKQIVEYYTLRWSIETTFQEVRAHLGFETTRHWSRAAVERVEPWLLVLFSLVTLNVSPAASASRLTISGHALKASCQPLDRARRSDPIAAGRSAAVA